MIEGSAEKSTNSIGLQLADLTARNQTGDVVPFAHERVYDSRYVCLMRKQHPLAARRLTLDDYCAARHLLVSYSGRPYGFTDEALAALGRERRIVLTVNQFFTAGRVVASSDLLTVLPLHFFGVTGLQDALVWRTLPFQLPTVHVDALWHVSRAAGAAHRWLRSVVARSATVENQTHENSAAV